MTDIRHIRWARHSQQEIARTRAQLAALDMPGGLSLFFEAQEAGESLRHIVTNAVRTTLKVRLDALVTDLALAGFSGDGIPAIEPDKPEAVAEESAGGGEAGPAFTITEEGALALEAATKAEAEKTVRSHRASAAATTRWSRVRKAARKQARTARAAKSVARSVKRSPAKKATKQTAKKTVKRKR